MKFKVAILCLVAVLVSCELPPGEEIYNGIQSIRIAAASEDLETPFSIPCNGFEVLMESDITVITISDSSRITKFERLLNHCFWQDNPKGHIDTRTKIIIYFKDDTTVEICFDRFNRLYQAGKGFSTSPELCRYTRNLVDNSFKN